MLRAVALGPLVDVGHADRFDRERADFAGVQCVDLLEHRPLVSRGHGNLGEAAERETSHRRAERRLLNRHAIGIFDRQRQPDLVGKQGLGRQHLDRYADRAGSHHRRRRRSAVVRFVGRGRLLDQAAAGNHRRGQDKRPSTAPLGGQHRPPRRSSVFSRQGSVFSRDPQGSASRPPRARRRGRGLELPAVGHAGSGGWRCGLKHQ